MIDRNLLEKVRAHVNRDGACGFGTKEVSGSVDVSDLIDLLLAPKGIEHCMKYMWPTIEMMLPYRNELEARGVYIAGSHGAFNPRLVIAFGGHVSITVDGYNVCEIYATNNATIEVSAKDNAFVSAEMRHGSRLHSNVQDKAKVRGFRR